MKILCTGDLHLGRRSSRLPDGEDGRLHSAAAAWDAAVELAIQERVNLVALSGDLVDEKNKLFEAIGPLERGVRRLSAAGIPVAAVAGNHDFDVLRRIAPSLGRSFCLLGRDGGWETRTVPCNGVPALRVVGWSFPQAHVRTSPMTSCPSDLGNENIPVLGLLHTDLDAPNSPYAPVSSAELRATGAGFWLLGHIHTPRLHEQPGGAPLLYPGSPQALDPGEPGAHGAWIVEMQPGQPAVPRHFPLSTVRYDTVEVDLTGVDDALEAEQQLAEGVRAHVQQVVEQGAGRLRLVSCRVRLTGRTPLHARLASELDRKVGELELEHGEVRARVERVAYDTRPAADLDALVLGNDAPGVLAKLIRALEADSLDAAQERMLTELSTGTMGVRRANAYQLLGSTALPTREELRSLAARQAYLLLDTILGQKEAA